jgi:hypothetical protein
LVFELSFMVSRIVFTQLVNSGPIPSPLIMLIL